MLPSPLSWQTIPSELLVVNSSQNEQGYYIFGFADFSVPTRHITSIFNRSVLGSQEDFILGVLCVIMIAVLTEIFQVILMRTRRRKVIASRVYTAVLFDEITHFRNVLRLARRRRESRSVGSSSILYSSLTILFFAFLLLSAEVFAVYLTQPIKIYAEETKYNLVGVQPAFTDRNISRSVNEASIEKSCISPMMPRSNRTREYSIVACIRRRVHGEDSKQTGNITFESVFHQAGSDHRIYFGDDSSDGTYHEITLRATLMQSEQNKSHALRFETRATKLSEIVLFLHHEALRRAAESECSGGSGRSGCSLATVGPEAFRTRNLSRTVSVWVTQEEVKEEANAYITEFRLGPERDLHSPKLSLENALEVFATSAVIHEREGTGLYVDLPMGAMETTVENLVSEEGRVAGVALIGLVLGILIAVLIVLRICFKPVSLAELVSKRFIDNIEHDVEGAAEGNEEVLDEWENIERDIVQANMANYESHVTFDPPDFSPQPDGWVHDPDSGHLVFR